MKIAPRLAWLLPLIVTSCGDLGGLGGLDVLGEDTGIAPVDPVFVCDLPTTGVELELCTDLDASGLAASVSDACGGAVTCSPSARVPGCLYHCPPPTHGGCDALESCWCPEFRVKCTPNAR